MEFAFIRFIVTPPPSEFVYSLPNILFKAFIVCEEINKAFFAAVELMIYFVGILNWGTSESRCFCNIAANFSSFNKTLMGI